MLIANDVKKCLQNDIQFFLESSLLYKLLYLDKMCREYVVILQTSVQITWPEKAWHSKG